MTHRPPDDVARDAQVAESDEAVDSTGEPVQLTSGTPAPSGARILVVDDEPQFLQLNVLLLESLGYSATPAGSAREALALLATGCQPTTGGAPSRSFDLVATDETMPGMSGLQLVRRMRDLGYAQPVLVLTGYQGVADEATLQALGVHAVLLKPVPRDTLARAVRAALEC